MFDKVSQVCSKKITDYYSTSFSSAIGLLHQHLRQPIYNIYGFVRLADEIVDTFHDYDQAYLLQQFKNETYDAIDRGISLNPILNSFQLTVNNYKVDIELIDSFFKSMELDLQKRNYDEVSYQEYIYGSAEVVGLMCLQIFLEGDESRFDELKPFAQSLGAAFQKVNFLRDLKADFEGLERVYFPNCDFKNFSRSQKLAIEIDIQKDFDEAFKGIIQLPLKARFGVYVAYKYYLSLFKKIKKVQPQKIMEERIRIPNFGKMLIVAKAGLRNRFDIL